MMDLIQPYVSTIVEALVGLLAVGVLAGVASIKAKVVKFVESHTNAQQQTMLYGLAQEAAALAESSYVSGGGPEKLQAAVEYVSKQAGKIGLDVSPLAMRAAVEKAVMEFNKNKPSAPVAEAPVEAAPVDSEAREKLDAIMAVLGSGGGPA